MPGQHQDEHVLDEEALDATLRSRGMRATPQRRLVLRALTELGHATPELLEEHLRSRQPQVNLSTVYRTLELLEQLGVVSHAHLTHHAPSYQIASHADHFHLVCRGCGALVEADLAAAGELSAVVLAEHGFTADLAHLSLHGWCEDCTAAGISEHAMPDHEGGEREATGPRERLHSHD